ncbi:MAG: ATP-binding cassette domain-containing protein, partial [Lachnospiraceae bacterium]|nr:ATP-binding cassette domain-containing protein [Lachnospiraceae bacterium]
YSQSKMQGDLIDTLGNIVEIKCMGMDNAVETNLQNNYQWLIAKFKEKTRVGNMMNCFTSMVNLGFPLAIYILGSFDVYEGNMSVGTLIAFVTLVGYFTSPFNTIIMLLPSINGVREVLLRYKELMNFRERNHDGNAMDGEFSNIKMREVFYRYNGGHDYALNNVSLDVQRGKRIAIVGSSGSGKSTLVKTLLGAVDIDQGNIYINNYEITEISREQIYKWFAIVTQNPMCLNASIRKNVDITGAFSDDEIWNALEIAELKDEIKNMPLGLDTLVGEGGQNISGGQKQRLAIARALIGNTEVLILDEATSNLDQMTEKKIYDNLKAINKTQIIVSHRLASIHNVDRIYVLNKGKIIE